MSITADKELNDLICGLLFFASSYTGFKMVHFSAYLACASEVMLTSGDGGFGRNSCSDSETSFHKPYLVTPHANLSTYWGRAFAYAGPTSWNSLPDNLKNVSLSLQTFKRHLKTFFFSSY